MRDNTRKCAKASGKGRWWRGIRLDEEVQRQKRFENVAWLSLMRISANGCVMKIRHQRSEVTKTIGLHFTNGALDMSNFLAYPWWFHLDDLHDLIS